RAGVREHRASGGRVPHLARPRRSAALAGQILVAHTHRVEPVALDRAAGVVVFRHLVAETGAVAGQALAALRARRRVRAARLTVAEARAHPGRIARVVHALHLRIGVLRDRNARPQHARRVAAAALVAVLVAADAVAARPRQALGVALTGNAQREAVRAGRRRARVAGAGRHAVVLQRALRFHRAVGPALRLVVGRIGVA